MGGGILNWEGRTVPGEGKGKLKTYGGQGKEAAQRELSQARSRLLAQSSPPGGARLRGWVKEHTGLLEGIVEELTRLANICGGPTTSQALCSVMAGAPRHRGRAGGLSGLPEKGLARAWRLDHSSAQLQAELGVELKF